MVSGVRTIVDSATTSTCLAFEDWTGARTVVSLGTNAGSTALPFQEWRHFKESFAPELVQRAVAETPGNVSRIVDPFGGSGTTALAAQFLGAEPATIEVNPFLADLIEAKLAQLDLDQVSSALKRVVHRALSDPRDSRSVFPAAAPKTLIEPGIGGRFLLYKNIADRIATYRAALAAEVDPGVRRLFRVILASATMPASNVVVSGKGRRYRRNWKNRHPASQTIDTAFFAGVSKAISDLRRFRDRRCRSYTLLRGDARQLVSDLPRHDLAVFSPPYPNSLDYTDVYNVELWTMGYLNSRDENTILRRSTMRSHVQIKRDMSGERLNSPTLSHTVRRLGDNRAALWNRHIPEMIAAYATDMATVLRGLAGRLRPGGRVYIVLGDSRYAAIPVPVASIVGEISEALGFQILSLEPCRAMRASPQQGGAPQLPESLLILERP